MLYKFIVASAALGLVSLEQANAAACDPKTDPAAKITEACGCATDDGQDGEVDKYCIGTSALAVCLSGIKQDAECACPSSGDEIATISGYVSGKICLYGSDATTAGTFVDCLVDGDCSGDTPKCSSATANTCVAAGTDDNSCAAIDAALPKFLAASGDDAAACVQCLADGDCSGDTPACSSVTANTCVAAGTDDNSCAAIDAALPRFSTGTNTCVAAGTDDNSCAAIDAALPKFLAASGDAAAACVQCLADGDCSGDTPKCSEVTANTCEAAPASAPSPVPATASAPAPAKAPAKAPATDDHKDHDHSPSPATVDAASTMTPASLVTVASILMAYMMH